MVDLPTEGSAVNAWLYFSEICLLYLCVTILELLRPETCITPIKNSYEIRVKTLSIHKWIRLQELEQMIQH